MTDSSGSCLFRGVMPLLHVLEHVQQAALAAACAKLKEEQGDARRRQMAAHAAAYMAVAAAGFEICTIFLFCYRFDSVCTRAWTAECMAEPTLR